MSDRASSRRADRQAARRVRPRRVRLGLGQCRRRQDPCAGPARDPAAARWRRRRRKSSASPSPRPPPPIWRTASSRRSATGPRLTMTRSTRRSRAYRREGRQRQTARRARRLFASALETPGGLKVQTIHAFCTRLLQQFPFEAECAARISACWTNAAAAAAGSRSAATCCWKRPTPQSALGRALDPVARACAAISPSTTCIRRGDRASATRSMRWLDAPAASMPRWRRLSVALGIDAERYAGGRWKPQFLTGRICRRTMASAADVCARRRSDKRPASACRRPPRLTAPSSVDGHICAFFRTAERDERAAQRPHQGHRQIESRACASAFATSSDRVCAAAANSGAPIAVRDRTARCSRCDAMLDRYRAEKNRRGLLDYDDLIARRARCSTSIEAAWVHLQARPRHRSCPDRRGAGHQPGAMGDHRASFVAEFIAGAGARSAIERARSSPSATRSSRSSPSRAPRPKPSTQRRSFFENAHRDAEAVSSRSDAAFVPLGAGGAQSGGLGFQGSAGAPGSGADPAEQFTKPCAKMRRVWSRSVDADRAGGKKRSRTLGRAFRSRDLDQSAREARAADRSGGKELARTRRTCRRWSGSPPGARGRHPHPGAAARTTVRSDHPRS